MQRHYFIVGVAVEKLLLFSIIISSLILITSANIAKHSLNNDFNLDQLKYSIANYEIIATRPFQLNGFKDDAADMFDKIMDLFSPYASEPSSGSSSRSRSGSRSTSLTGSMRNIEYFTIHKIIGDGRCMFRALVKGMATNDGVALDSDQEKVQADELKMDVKRVICDSDNEHEEFDDAILAITIEENLESYCERIIKSTFWGGEAELLILSKLLSLPVTVYVPVKEGLLKVDESAGFISIAKYRPEFKNGSTRAEPKKDVRLLFNGRLGGNHYDLLL